MKNPCRMTKMITMPIYGNPQLYTFHLPNDCTGWLSNDRSLPLTFVWRPGISTAGQLIVSVSPFLFNMAIMIDLFALDDSLNS